MRDEVDHAEIRSMLDEIDDVGQGLTDWEVEFISRLVDEDVTRFSWAQAEKIEQIYAERT